MTIFLELIRFSLIGLFATATHLTIAYIFIRIFIYDSVYLINFVAFAFAITISYLGHLFITFKKNGNFFQFMFVSGMGFLINNSFLFLGLFFGIDNFMAIVFASSVPPIIVFLFSKFWVFSHD